MKLKAQPLGKISDEMGIKLNIKKTTWMVIRKKPTVVEHQAAEDLVLNNLQIEWMSVYRYIGRELE